MPPCETATLEKSEIKNTKNLYWNRSLGSGKIYYKTYYEVAKLNESHSLL